MRCETVRRALSREIEGESLSVAALKHLATCPHCPAYRVRLHELHARTVLLRGEPTPDVTTRVMAALPSQTRFGRARLTGLANRSRARWLAPAAGLAAGALIGVVLAGGLSGPSVSLAGRLPEAVVAGQASIREMSASFTVLERIRSGVERTYQGDLAFSSPEYLSLSVVQTDRPDGWPDNSWSVLVDGMTSLAVFPFPCPALGGCPDAPDQSILTSGRDPFSAISPAPLDAVVPVAVLLNAEEPVRLPGRTILDRPSLGFEVTAAQARPLLNALFGIGNWREIHDTDIVDVWLDTEFFTPLAVTVTASASPDRATWAARRGYEDPLEDPYLLVDYRAVGFDPVTRTEPIAPAEAVHRDAGYTERVSESPIETGMPQVAAGVVDGFVESQVWAWSDGRAWLRLDRTSEWDGPGLFGNSGLAVYPIEGGNGTVYVAGDGSAVFVHGADFDAVISGSVDTDRLAVTAGSLPVQSLQVPPDWPEAASPIEVAATAYVPANLRGFGDPIVHSVDGVLVIDLFGAGDRSARITQRPAETLSPPLDPDARAVPARNTTARYSPMLGLLEWIEGGIGFSIEAPTLSVDEIVGIAESLAGP